MLRLKKESRQNQPVTNGAVTLTDRMGFTLIELTVVMALISIMLVVALPRIKNDLLVDQTNKTSRWLLTTVRYLKEASIGGRLDHTLHVDMQNGKLWITHDVMEDEMVEKAKTDALTLSGGIRILDVELAGHRKITDGVAQIHFYAKGYSDNAMIHVVNEDGRELSYRINPFMQRMKIIEGYVELEA